jgi:hypothetical protein
VTESMSPRDWGSVTSVRRIFLVPAGLALVVLCGLALYTLWYIVSVGGLGYDAHAYWLAGRSAHPYQAAPGQYDAFLYSPVFALLMRPLALLPWSWFFAMWFLAESCAFLWLLAPLPWKWQIPCLIVCLPEIAMGNIYGFLGVAAVAGMRRPETWAFAFLTKVTPGGIGLVWFAARGEWRKVARCTIATLTLSAMSFAVTPGLWKEWFTFLLRHGGDNGFLPFMLLATAAIITAIAARTDQAWLLPLAMMIAVPTFEGNNKDLAMLVSAARLRESLAGKGIDSIRQESPPSGRAVPRGTYETSRPSLGKRSPTHPRRPI